MEILRPDVDRKAKGFSYLIQFSYSAGFARLKAGWATDHSGGLLPWRGSSWSAPFCCIINKKVWLRLFFRGIVHRGEKLVEGEVVEFAKN